MSFFKRLGAFGSEMSKAVWITSVKQLAQRLDSRFLDWDETTPDAVKKPMYDKLWEELGKPSMQMPRDKHVLVQEKCAQLLSIFFRNFHETKARS